MLEKIRLAIAIVKTAAVFVKDEYEIIIIPPIIAIFTAILWVWWIISVM